MKEHKFPDRSTTKVETRSEFHGTTAPYSESSGFNYEAGPLKIYGN